MTITIGALFAGIGGFELGLERAIPGAQTIWQVEQNEYCQRILKKHWPHAQLFDDVCEVGAHNLPPVDILCGGFPCQDISIAGKKEGLNGKKSSLWFEMRRIISELQPSIVIMENVPAITIRGLSTVLADLAQLRYDAEWCIVSARDFGAPHLRKRWFCVAYTNRSRLQTTRSEQQTARHKQCRELDTFATNTNSNRKPNGTINAQKLDTFASNTDTTPCQKQSTHPKRLATESRFKYRDSKDDGIHKRNYWQAQITPKPILCDMDDGVPERVARLKALGNAIVPQCSQWIGEQVLASGLLDEHYIKICEASK